MYLYYVYYAPKSMASRVTSDAVIPVTVRTFAVTTIETVVVSGSYAELVGVKATDNVCVPTGRRWRAGGRAGRVHVCWG